MNINRKAISPVVAIALLLVVSVVAVVGFQNWYSGYQSVLTTDIEQRSTSGSVSIEHISSEGIIYVTNTYDTNQSMDSIKVGDSTCNLNQNLEPGVNQIDITPCLLDTEESESVKIITDEGIIEKEIYLGDTLDEMVNALGAPITNCNDLQNIENDLTADYYLANNIDCSDTLTWNTGSGFVPISSFTGTLNGYGFTINNLFINRSTTDFQGLFGTLNGGNVSNLGITNINLTAADSSGCIAGYQNANSYILNSYCTGNLDFGDTVGGLVGDQYLSYIIDSYSSVIMKTSSGAAGGIVGYLYDSYINDSYFNGEIHGGGGEYDLGGIIGTMRGGAISNVYSSGLINGTSTGIEIGGLVGFASSNYYIFNSYNLGEVNGQDYVGGLIGSGTTGTINSSYNLGDINSYGKEVGGLVGTMGALSIYNSYSNSNIISTGNDVGGLAGYVGGGLINNSYNLGNVTGNSNVGGGVGRLSAVGSIYNIYSTGNIGGSLNLGGLVGTDLGGTTTSSYWDTQTSGQAASAAGSGNTTAQMMSEATFSGWDFTTIWQINEGLSYPTLR